MLRRLKSEVASQLTAKQQHEQVVEMTQQQTKVYHKAVQYLRAKIGANGKGVFAWRLSVVNMFTRCEWSYHLIAVTRLWMILLCLIETLHHELTLLLSKGKQRMQEGRKTVPEGQTVKQLGKQQVNSQFTHLRKIAQHPLLVHNLFSDGQVQSIVKLAQRPK